MRENADQKNSEYGHFLRSVEHENFSSPWSNFLVLFAVFSGNFCPNHKTKQRTNCCNTGHNIDNSKYIYRRKGIHNLQTIHYSSMKHCNLTAIYLLIYQVNTSQFIGLQRITKKL